MSNVKNQAPEDRYIIRLDGANNAGWQLRMPAWHPQPISQYFADSLHGGSAAAKARAREMRDRLFEAADVPLRLKGYTKAGGDSGLPSGVFIATRYDKVGISAYQWMAVWSDEAGKQRKKSFAIAKYGFMEALHRAIQFRCEGTNWRVTAQQYKAALAEMGRLPLASASAGTFKLTEAERVDVTQYIGFGVLRK